jgi:hypothetical protein
MPCSKLLDKLHERRVKLRRDERHAHTAHRSALEQLQQAEHAEHQADGRATALHDQAGLKQARARLTKATREAEAAEQAAARATRAMQAIDAAMLKVARDGYDELLNELGEDDVTASDAAELARQTFLAACEQKRSVWRTTFILTGAMGDRERNRGSREPVRPERAIVEGIAALFPHTTAYAADLDASNPNLIGATADA